MQLPNSAFERLRDVLQDIVSNIQIKSNFCISHPKSEVLELPTEVVSRLQQLPVERQNHYLSRQLRNFLYSIYYIKDQRTTLALNANSASLLPHLNIEDNIVREQYLKFSERLHESNCGQGYFDLGWRVLRQEINGNVAVRKNGLTLQIERDLHLQVAERTASIGELVAIRMPPNLIEPGFYVAVGNAGLVNYRDVDNHLQSTNIYFNLSPEGAIAVMKAITWQLNEIGMRFAFKALSNPSEYTRYDSGILHFERTNYEVVRSVLQSVYTQNKLYFQTVVPLFTKSLAPGLAIAEEPISKFASQEAFGMNRCQVIANGLLEAQATGDESTENRMALICKHFSLLGISLQRPYLNAESEDIYTPLEN